ncbi:MAG: YceI family protein [Flavobacteriales bacterium]
MQKKIFMAIAAITILSTQVQAQKFYTKSGLVHFFSDAKMEDINADNNSASCVIDASSGAMEWSLLNKGFTFESAFMQEHFNENYMESDKFPKSTFKGTISNMSAINLKKDGNYTANVSGDLTMHGVTKNMSTTATFTVSGGKISCSSKFYVKPSDFNINIPGDKKDSISNNIEITVSGNLQELKK